MVDPRYSRSAARADIYQYCADNFAAEKIRVTGQQRTDLITGFTQLS